MNSVNLLGRITNKLEIIETQKNKKYLKFNLAIKRDENNTDFINCVAWNKTAELIYRYCKKGVLLGVSGEIRVDKYEANEKVSYFTTILVNKISFAGNKNVRDTENISKNESFNDLDEDEEFPF